MRRYSIIARESGGTKEVVVAQCDSNPQAIVEEFRARRRPGKLREPTYEHVRFEENAAEKISA